MKKLIFSSFFIVFCNFAAALNCDDIKKDPNSYFINMVANQKDDPRYLSANFECENSLFSLNFLKPLYEVSVKIRNDNIDCIGNLAIINEKKFQEKLALMGIAPKVFENRLDKSKPKPDKKKLELWSHSSIRNFMLFNKFKDEYNKSFIGLIDFFKQNYDENYAKILAENMLDEYIKFAFANYENSLEFSEFDRILHIKNITANDIKEFVYSHDLSEFELTKALHTAILHNKSTEILKVLIDRGANLNYGDENSIFFAINSPKILKFLIANGADINYKNSFGLTPIFYVAELKDPELLKFFIYNGAKLNTKLISNTEKMAFISNNSYQKLCAFDEPSKTLLMHSAQFGDKNITELLVKNGANEFVLDDFGLNALDYAILSEDNETIKYLQDL